MTDRAWPGWDQPGVQQITGMSATEWEWLWSSRRKFLTELGVPLGAHQVEDVPWGAIRWTWKKGELYYEPVFANSLDDVERVQRSARRSMAATTRGAIVGVLVVALFVVLGAAHLHWWHWLVLLAGGIVGALLGTAIGRLRHAVTVLGEKSEDSPRRARAASDLPAIMETWRALRAIQDQRRLFLPLSRVYGRAVIDFYGSRVHVRSEAELAAILQALQSSIVSIHDIREMDELTRPVSGAIETLADAVDLDPRTSAAMAEELQGLSVDVARGVRARRREEQALRGRPDADRDLDAFRAEQALKAATAQVEQVRRTYRIEAELSDIGRNHIDRNRTDDSGATGQPRPTERVQRTEPLWRPAPTSTDDTRRETPDGTDDEDDLSTAQRG